MFYRIADVYTESKEEHLPNGEERGAKDDVANRPSVVERAENENELKDDVYDGTNERPKNVYDS